jgi:hypothetical protein
MEVKNSPQRNCLKLILDFFNIIKKKNFGEQKNQKKINSKFKYFYGGDFGY